MFQSKSVKTTLIAAALAFCGSASAAPTGGGIYDVYAGSAWFHNNQGVVVTAGTYSSCVQKLNDAISYRTSNWGWTVTNNEGCRKTNYLSFHQLSMAELEDDYNIGEYEEKLENIKLTHQIQMDNEIAALEQEYRIEEFKSKVAEQTATATTRK